MQNVFLVQVSSSGLSFGGTFSPKPKDSIFCTSYSLCSPFYSLSLLDVTQIRGHIAGSPPPHPCGSCLAFFIARRLQLFLASSTPRRIVPTHARRSQQLILFIFRKKHVQNITTAGFELHMSRINTILVRSSIRGQPQDHRGDRLYNAPPQHE